MQVGSEYVVEWVDAGGILNFDKESELKLQWVAMTRGRFTGTTMLRGKRLVILATTTYEDGDQNDLTFIPKSLIVRVRRPTRFVDEKF